MLQLVSDYEKLRTIKAIVFDWDGVFTNNSELIGFADGSIVKSRSHYDGQGVSLLRDIGLHIAIATNETEANAKAANFLVDKWNNLPSTKQDVPNRWPAIKLFTGVGGEAKAKAATEWLKSLGVSLKECAAMGDDLVDWPLLKIVGFRAAPVTAEAVVKDVANFISQRPAGSGAVRDFANAILDDRKIDQTTLRTS